MSLVENTRKPVGLGGKLMVAAIAAGRCRVEQNTLPELPFLSK